VGLAECFSRGLLIRGSADPASARRSQALAHRYLADAEKSLSIDTYRPVIIMSYTAMFHSARAILFRDGIRERGHECIPLYIREMCPALKAEANKLDSYRKFRHEALYGLEFEAGKPDAVAAIAVAGEFLSAVEKVLADR
jgi:uncharacterized protein (UPF0332 family)